ncbi:glutathionylspermidine synthase family protein [Catenuloplanes japonicus]|uniref:glutathionylspermidine synthase family protein n=1 Tax=Catenuloplanes japonicus TaxID=33876 RepID=UPI00052605C5|nr:glutathionylspermidine synthase family protein [Catenuloplanes japonicus]
MRRESIPARPDWRAENARLGLVYNDTGATSYWREGARYVFTAAEIDELETAAATLHEMCVAAGDHIVGTCPRRDRTVRANRYLDSVCTPDVCLLSRFGVPEFAHAQVIRTWQDGSPETWTHWDKDLDAKHPPQPPDYSPGIYGRFDVRYDGDGPPKLLEFNAQTPTSLLEGAITQWRWLEQTGAPDQWNSLHEALVEAWRRNLAELRAARPWLPENLTVHFAYETSETSGEDRMNTAYLQETCRQAGYDTELIGMSQIGWDTLEDRMVFEGRHLDVVFALYPWEWIWHEEGGRPIFRDQADPMKRGTVWIEPPYTAALWGNKGLLPVLWTLFGDDPARGRYLLPAYFADEKPEHLTSYAMKPLWGREGASTRLVLDGAPIEDNPGPYGEEGFVVQALAPLPGFESADGVMHPVLGVWLVDGEPAGMGLRESAGLITRNDSHFVPHVISAP